MKIHSSLWCYLLSTVSVLKERVTKLTSWWKILFHAGCNSKSSIVGILHRPAYFLNGILLRLSGIKMKSWIPLWDCTLQQLVLLWFQLIHSHRVWPSTNTWRVRGLCLWGGNIFNGIKVWHVWDAIDRAVCKHFPPLTTFTDKTSAVQEEWRLLNSVKDLFVNNSNSSTCRFFCFLPLRA